MSNETRQKNKLTKKYKVFNQETSNILLKS